MMVSPQDGVVLRLVEFNTTVFQMDRKTGRMAFLRLSGCVYNCGIGMEFPSLDMVERMPAGSPPPTYMDSKSLSEHIARLQDTYYSGKTKNLAWRKSQLQGMKRMFKEHYADFEAALYADMNKSPFECFATEIGFLEHEVEYALERLDSWARPKPVSTPVFLQPAHSRVMFEPLGVTLILGAWNYPMQLTLGPLVAAIAAGNAAVVKLPRTAKNVFQVVSSILPHYLDPEAFLIIADDTANDVLLDQHWDKIFFTGSAEVGRIILQAAVRYLTPVTLELGGKSPALVDETADLAVASRRIAQGKFFNAGQTCVSPDYILVQESVLDALVAELIKTLREFYGDDPRQSAEYARIINAKQFDTLVNFFKDGEIVLGGQSDRNERYIAPTILKNVSPDAPVMQNEIFGPILPVLAVKDMDEALRFVQQREKPLAFYVFSENRKTVEKILSHSTSGGACVNETMNHLAIPGLPFGGVGNSGMGKYHGEWGFREFSNARAVLDHATSFDPAVRYPPYDGEKLGRMKKLMTMRVPSVFEGLTGWLLSIMGDWILRFIK
jgi:aldehyde dehydrogenase (NAD+)